MENENKEKENLILCEICGKAIKSVLAFQSIDKSKTTMLNGVNLSNGGIKYICNDCLMSAVQLNLLAYTQMPEKDKRQLRDAYISFAEQMGSVKDFDLIKVDK